MAKKASNNWLLLNIFSSLWSEQYQGEIYPRSGRDLRASKEFLELYPNFFADEVEQMAVRGWIQNFLRDNFWHKPNGSPPLRHEFCYFVAHASKYTNAQKKVSVPVTKIKMDRMIDVPEISDDRFKEVFDWRKNLTGE